MLLKIQHLRHFIVLALLICVMVEMVFKYNFNLLQVLIHCPIVCCYILGIKSPGQEKLSPDGFKGENLLVPGLPFNDSTRITFNVITSIIIVIAMQMF